MLSGAKPKLNNQHLRWSNLNINFTWLLKLSRLVVWAFFFFFFFNVNSLYFALKCNPYFTCNNRIMPQPSVSLALKLNCNTLKDKTASPHSIVFICFNTALLCLVRQNSVISILPFFRKNLVFSHLDRIIINSSRQKPQSSRKLRAIYSLFSLLPLLKR